MDLKSIQNIEAWHKSDEKKWGPSPGEEMVRQHRAQLIEEVYRLRAALQKIKDLPYDVCGTGSDTDGEIYQIANDALGHNE